ncbi:TPA: 50S ribosomal protein L18e [Candidatus Pacearchaeota archaeon]|jgi:large subunit ribosomal protein L18e|nr:50S ribosomal protein L18e [Candidatus Pacearchaeota archaeon]
MNLKNLLNKMISKTKINKRLRKKGDLELIETILEAKKNREWIKLAKLISGPRKNYPAVNLKRIENETSEGDTIVIPGKVLGSGEINKKIRVCALNFSENAKRKLAINKSEVIRLIEEIKKNPKAEGVKLIK